MRRSADGLRAAVVTCSQVRKLDSDGEAVMDALRSVGLSPEAVVWDEPGVDWAGFRVVLLRSTWDYPERFEEFLSWARRVDRVTRLLNSFPVVRWNADKRYLSDLESEGLPVVPTRFISPGTPPALPASLDEYVVKPAISAGSRNTARYGIGDEEAALAHVERLLHEGRTVMVQPYLGKVDSEGESALVYLDGRYRHAARKGPILERGSGLIEGLFAPEKITPKVPSREEREVADRVISSVRERFGPPAYARVDFVPGPEGAPLLLELELIEPSLFFEAADGDAGPLAARVAADAVW